MRELETGWLRKARSILSSAALGLLSACGSGDPHDAVAPVQAEPDPGVNPATIEPRAEPVADVPPPAALPRWKRTSAQSAQAEKAVLDGLRWLARHQAADGSWSVESSKERCSAGTSCFDAELEATHAYDEGLTALALLSFLDVGFTHESRHELVDTVPERRRYRTGDVVKNGLQWLKQRQKADGSFSRDQTFLYNEALATAALAEAFRQTKNRYWKEPAQRGVDFLQAAQRPSPAGKGLWGWRYDPRQVVEARIASSGGSGSDRDLYDADTSVTTSCLLALMRASRAGLRVDQRSVDGSWQFCEFVTASNGLVGYLDAESAGATITGRFDDHFAYHHTTMSALGMCIRLFPTLDFEDPFLQLGAKRIIGDLPRVTEDHSSIDYYYWHHATLALQEFDGESSPARTGRYWGPWSKALLEAVLPLQTHSEHDCSDGGWLTSDRWGNASGAGPLYNTSVNVRTLEICFNPDSSPPPKDPLVGSPAPNFEAFEDPTSPLALSDFRGRVVLVDFLSPSAPGFEMDLKARSSLAARMKGRRLTILTFFTAESGDDRFPSPTERSELSWKCIRVRDANHPILLEYKVRKFPTTIVVDPAGIVRGAPLGWDDTVLLVNGLLDETEREAQPK